MKIFESDWMLSVAKQIVNGVNSALAMSPGSQKHLKNLESCTLKIHIESLDSDFYFGVAKQDMAESAEPRTYKYRVQLIEPSTSPDVTLSGSPIAFIKLFSQKNKSPLFQSKELKLEGDAVRIQQILAFLSSLQVDWDGILANFIGDVPAHFIGSSLRAGMMWGLSFSQSLIRDTEEYIKYELRLLPDKRRTAKQFSAISKLAKEVDKLKHRFDQLEKNIDQ